MGVRDIKNNVDVLEGRYMSEQLYTPPPQRIDCSMNDNTSNRKSSNYQQIGGLIYSWASWRCSDISFLCKGFDSFLSETAQDPRSAQFESRMIAIDIFTVKQIHDKSNQ